ncbi:hypothetical protein [Thalassococcus sp. S3]|uniref:hypothetical protein n=1 Tax=Thalassococcus sp. S3 TaxID=2017482 RepID=UPI0010243ABF|nr:hypothetical protein [Thalassococcus sp. S3]QBF31531.1 hypothetical protein CFI11_09925 [Thalassococcus sp. S3]
MSDRAEIIQMARDGVKSGEIARALSITPNRVYGILCMARKQGEDIPRYRARARTRKSISLPAHVLQQFNAPATARGLSDRALCTRLLTIIAAEPSLIGAVLDDGVSHD